MFCKVKIRWTYFQIARCFDQVASLGDKSFDIMLSSWWFHIFFIFTPKIGEDEPILTHIFQLAWFNHQVELLMSSRDALCFSC